MFRAFGHENSSILDGGLPAWEAEGLSVDDSPPKEVGTTRYPTPVLDRSTVASATDYFFQCIYIADP